MERTMKYTPPTSIEELQNFQKLNHRIEGEDWASVIFDGWENYEISSYGRLYNTKTKRFKKCYISSHVKVEGLNINSIVFSIRTDSNTRLTVSVCDLIMYSFYPDYADEFVNPIPLDGNMFNLSFGNNLKFVCNAYYEGDNVYKEVPIYIDDEKSKYTLDTNGVIINQDTGRTMRSKYNEANDTISIYHGLIRITNTRARWMAKAFIPNPNNLRNAALIDFSDTRPSLDNICWTDRYKLVKK